VSKQKEAQDLLRGLSTRVKQAFDDDRTLLSFDEWFSLLLERPMPNLRSASQYIRDVFDYFGTEVRHLPMGDVVRYKLFDAPWADGDGRVAGQEAVQGEVYRLISNFVRDGRVSKLILLHGPNGSAKSSMVHCIQAGMEHYSRVPAGALYSYSWIFPSEKIVKGRLGFASTGEEKSTPGGSYAHLSTEQIDARLPCEMRDHPIFLLPRIERLELVRRLKASGALPKDFVVSKYILEGDLSPRDRAIYDALLMANDGDHAEVLRYVQVERFYVSSKYGRAIATVEPQMHVDAAAHQITADRSIANLPRALQSVPLFEIQGPLVSANRGMLEFADLLKRPIEAFKYLLTTSEEATASLPQFMIHLDEVLIGSSNEKQLEAFKEYPDWNSFKGRIELVRVPYLRRFSDEVQIYERQITQSTIDKPLAPHVVQVAAMWAVLTRLKWPDPDHYDGAVKNIVRRLKPTEKLELYDSGRAPRWCSEHEVRELSQAIATIYDEYRTVLYYEGQIGASAREIRTLILNAAHHPEFRCLTPLPVLEELRELVRDPSIYTFLKQEPRETYHDAARFIDLVESWWLDIIDEEMRHSMGLVEEAQHVQLFSKYVVHVSHFVKKEKMLDKVTGKYVDADQDMMREVESVLLASGEDREEFRRAVIGRIGAWGLENAGKTPDYKKLFPRYIEKMEEDYYRSQRKVITKNLKRVLDILNEGEIGNVEEKELEIANRTIAQMEKRYGYARVCTAECFSHLLKKRYADPE
jgi:predicted Ser/Thr protein kinase